MTKLIIFDCDGVLVADFDREKYRSTFMKPFLKKYGQLDDVSIGEALETQGNLWSMVEDKVMTGKMSQKEGTEFWLEKMGLDKELADKFIEGDMNFWKNLVMSEPIDDVKATLARLRSMGYNIAVLSNDVRHNTVKKEILSWVGIDKHVDGIYTAHSIGYKKPEAGAYIHVTKSFKAIPAETVFVGHQDYEIMGAKNAGLKTICIRKEFCPIADFHIKRFSSLPSIL